MLPPGLQPFAAPLLAASALIALACAIIYGLQRRQQARIRALPPGPAPTWSGTWLPARDRFRYIYDLSKQFGPLVTIWYGTTPTVVCNNYATAENILEKSARDTTDRPFTVAALPHLWGKRPLFVPYGERWRRLRKALGAALAPSAARHIRVTQEKTGRDLIQDILAEPDKFAEHINTYAATLVVNIAYGRTDRARYSDPDIALNLQYGDRLGKVLLPGTFWIQSFPWLRHVPGYMRTIQGWADDEINLFRGELAKVQDRLARGAPQPPCFATYLLEHQKELQLSFDEIASLCGSVFAAGSETTSAALAFLVMSAACSPAAQKRVQVELDEAFGDSPPTFDEIAESDTFPLLRAFIAESFRWRPVSASGFTHKSTADISYNGYVFPAGTHFVGNHWAISRDEEYFGPDVEEFVIDRWLEKDAEGVRLKPKMKTVQFGFGRRVCPGQHVGYNSVLINAALLLWSFDMRKKVDMQGKEVEIDTFAFTNTMNVHPLAYQVQFTPRHKNLDVLLEN